jgi:hypothetical protein
MTFPLRLNTALGALLDRLAGEASPAHSPSAAGRPLLRAHDAAPKTIALVSISTLGIALFSGSGRFNTVLEAVAAWAEAHDLTWIE